MNPTITDLVSLHERNAEADCDVKIGLVFDRISLFGKEIDGVHAALRTLRAVEAHPTRENIWRPCPRGVTRNQFVPVVRGTLSKSYALMRENL